MRPVPRPGPGGSFRHRARYYSPARQRFLSADPAGAGHSCACANNAPANATDPSGAIPMGGLADVAFLAFDLARTKR